MPTIVPAGQGIRTTAGWPTGFRPQRPRDLMLFLKNNGDLTFTGMMSMLKRSKPKDPRFSQFTKNTPQQAGAITEIYSDALMANAYSAGNNAAGMYLYVKVAEALAKELRAGHTVLLRDSDDYRDDVAAVITEVTYAGASSKITVRTLEATTNSTSKDPSSADRLLVIGNANEENSVVPDSINYNPIEMWNYCQIFRTPYRVSGTQLETEMVGGSTLKEEKREKFFLHGIEIEKAFIWGRRHIETVNGMPCRYTMGIIPMIQEYASSNCFDYTLEAGATYAGKTWIEMGKYWLDSVCETLFTYGSSEKLVVAGNGFLTGIQRIAENFGLQLNNVPTRFGYNVREYVTPFGTLMFKTHPLLSLETTNKNTGIVLEPDNLEEMVLRDTQSRPDINFNKGGHNSVDGICEEWLTETGLFFKHPDTFGLLNGVGLDNTQGT